MEQHDMSEGTKVEIHDCQILIMYYHSGEETSPVSLTKFINPIIPSRGGMEYGALWRNEN